MSLKIGPKIWQLHRAMSGNKAQAQILDFRWEDDIWVRTLENKGTAFLGWFLRQTDQGNEKERSTLIRRLQYHYRYKLTMPREDIEAEDISGVIENASESARGPDGEKYSDLKTLNCQELHCHTD